MTNGRVEVIASVGRRLVAATLAPDASVSAIAREAGIHPSQLSGWRRRFGAAMPAGFAPVRIAGGPGPEGPAGGDEAAGRRRAVIRGARGGSSAHGADPKREALLHHHDVGLPRRRGRPGADQPSVRWCGNRCRGDAARCARLHAQRNFAFLDDLRTGTDAVKRRVALTVVGAVVTAALAYLALGLRQ